MPRKLTTKEFIRKARAVHGDKYDYSKVVYVGAKSKVIITCPTHGDFEQIPTSHLGGSGCPRCSGNVKSSTEEFIEKVRVVHNDKYDYSKVEYVSARKKVIITCPTHGDFEQRPKDHLWGQDCPRCKKPRTSYDKMTVEQRQRVKDVYTYHLRFEGNGELFDKIGISGDLPNRICRIQQDSKKAYKLVSGRARRYENADIAYEMEYKLLENQQLTKNNKYSPQIPFGGDSECIVPRGNPNMFDSTCIPERSDRFNYDDYKGD